MAGNLEQSVKTLGEGEEVELEGGEVIFKLSSYEGNPIVRPEDLGLTWSEGEENKVGAVFNAGAECYQDKVILMPRCHKKYKKSMYFDAKINREKHCLDNYISEVWPLVSEDGIQFKRLGDTIIRGDGTDHKDFVYGIEDIRIIKYGETYLLVGCGKIKPAFRYSGADRIAIYTTEDFLKFDYRGIVEAFDSRNAVPFSETIKGKLYMLLRFHPNIHLDILEAGVEQLLNPQRYHEEWEETYRRREASLLLKANIYPHEREKVGPSTQIIKTDKGWLFIYHSVGEIDSALCKEYGVKGPLERSYSINAALLALDNPKEVICRTRKPIHIPSTPYELEGDDKYSVDVPDVTFPVGAIVKSGKLLLYCGAGDKYIALLSCNLGNLVSYLLNNCKV